MRRNEIKKLLSLSPDEMLEKAGTRLEIVDDIDLLHQHFALSIASEIETNNANGQSTKLILPVGPVGQYPLFAEIINQKKICLKNCWFFMMDEHCDDNGIVLPADHPLSFRFTFHQMFTEYLDSNLMIPTEQLIFPDHLNVQSLQAKIDSVGGIDTTYGGIGIHGHLAYNEPEPNVRQTDPRIVSLNDFTRTMNAIRSQIGGNLEGHPQQGVTLGMNQILNAKRIRLYCRNGIDLDWANTVLRLALFGEPDDDYPVTYIRQHNDVVIVTDKETAKQPKFIV